MFTGLVETIGTVTSLDRTGALVSVGIESSLDTNELALGDSVMVDGYCQTVVRKEGKRFFVEVSPETLSRTTAADLKVGSRVNLERALRLSDRLGGHLVSGHVDCVGQVVSARMQGDFWVLTIRLPKELTRYVIQKGSITVDGISLTVNKVNQDRVELGIIPHTMDNTVLKDRKAGGRVNIEVDLVGKYIEKLLFGQEDPGKKGITKELLLKYGFAD